MSISTSDPAEYKSNRTPAKNKESEWYYNLYYGDVVRGCPDARKKLWRWYNINDNARYTRLN